MFRFPPMTPFARGLLIALALAFIAQLVAGGWSTFNWASFFALSPQPSAETLWQTLTFPFVQGDIGFVIFALFLWLALAPLEESLGVARVCQLLVVMSMGAALPVLVAGLVASPAASGAALGPLRLLPLSGIGAHLSGAIMAFAWPRRQQGPLNFFGVLPLTAKQLLVVIVVMAALPLLAERNISPLLGDLGAIAAAVFFVRPRKTTKRKKKPQNKAGLRLVHDVEEKPKYLN